MFCIMPRHDKTNKVTVNPAKTQDQPGRPPSLIRVFAVRMKQAELSLRWAHSHFVGFVMSRLILYSSCSNCSGVCFTKVFMT